MNIAVGQTVQLSIYPAPTAEGIVPSWSSSDPCITLEASADGASAVATASAVGNAKVTVNQEAASVEGSGGTVLHTATLDLNVVAEPADTGISILVGLPTPPDPPVEDTKEAENTAESRRDKRQAERTERQHDRHS